MSEAFKKYDGQALLTALCYGEARGEGAAGMIACAWVARNRVLRPGWWGRTWKDVILQPLQFSCFNGNDPNSALLAALLAAPDQAMQDPAWREARWVAAGVINGDVRDATRGADHYHAAAILPVWARGRQPVATIGSHVFYRLR